MNYTSSQDFLSHVELRNPGQPEYLQAVSEVIHSLWPFICREEKYAEQGLLDRLIEP